MDHDREPAFENLPTATDIAHWFVDEMRGVENVGGDAWWLSRDPHSSARMYAFVDWDVQEFWLLEIATGDTDDLLFVTNGCDGFGCEWWRNPTPSSQRGYEWHHDGLVWFADRISVHLEQL